VICRLFGMSGGRHRVRATFWLLEAPDSLAEQSRRHPDGYGIGTFEEDGSPDIDKRPAAAYEDQLFAREAREEESPTFVAHVRYASRGPKTAANTHPFELAGRVFAHNGHIASLDTLQSRLGSDTRRLQGQTDSERFFALISREVREKRRGRRGRDLHGGGLDRRAPAAVLAELRAATPTDVWALRYPETNLDAASPAGTVQVRSGELGRYAAVLFASEQMDEDPGWHSLKPGELVHVSADLEVRSRIVLDSPPTRPLRLEDLDPRAAASER
jgi:predicted glutamine amidotransferase